MEHENEEDDVVDKEWWEQALLDEDAIEPLPQPQRRCPHDWKPVNRHQLKCRWCGETIRKS